MTLLAPLPEPAAPAAPAAAAAAALSSPAPDLLFVSMEDWDDVWRRNQFLCAAYAARHPGARVLFVGLPRNVSHGLSRGRLSALRRPATHAAPVAGRVTVTRPLKLLPNALPLGRGVNDALFRRHVARAARAAGLRDPVLWLNPHSAVHMAGRMGERAVVYDVTDDWTSLTQSPALARLVARQDRALCGRADATIVCSPRLFEMKAALARHVHLIPNAVDAGHYRRVLDGTGPLPAEAAAWDRPVFGYTGTIHPDRVDVGLVESLARGLGRGTVVLIGPNHLRPGEVERLRRTGRVALPGPRPYGTIPDLMRAFDVCITPHLRTPFTESLNPIKLWEYLAAGKPVVSTDVAGFRDYPELVRLASTPAEFAAACAAALAEGAARSELRRREVRRHSWEARLDMVEAVLAGAIASRARGAAARPAGRCDVSDRPLVSVIIVSFNTRQMTLDCLRALHADLGDVPAEVWVVDNASTDGSAAAVRAAHPRVALIENPTNAGFGAANNLALRRAAGEFLLLLNSDAFPEPGAVAAMVRYLRDHPAVGAVGPRLLNADGTLQRSCHPFPSPGRAWLENLFVSYLLPNHPAVGDYRRWAHDAEREVDFVIGACLLVRRAAYERVGGFDEGFFMYSEETDWQRRIRAGGWTIGFTPHARVTHLGGGSGAANTAGPGQRWRVSTVFLESLDYYELKHHGLTGLISFRAAMAAGALIRAAAWAGVLVASPARRREAWAQARKYADLLVRQTTRWQLPPAALAARRTGNGGAAG